MATQTENLSKTITFIEENIGKIKSLTSISKEIDIRQGTLEQIFDNFTQLDDMGVKITKVVSDKGTRLIKIEEKISDLEEIKNKIETLEINIKKLLKIKR